MTRSRPTASGVKLHVERNREALWAIPTRWCWTEVNEVGVVALGRQRSPKDHHGPMMRPYVRAANITWDGWSLDDVKDMNFDETEFEQFRLHNGDVLLNEGSGSAQEVGKPAIWREQIPNCCFQNTLLRVRPLACTSEYMHQFFLHSALTGRFVSSTQGVNIFHIGKLGLAEFPIAVPPLPEQRRIVAKIDSLSNKSKRAREHLNHIPRLVEKYKQAVLAAAYESACRLAREMTTLGQTAVEVRNGLSKKPSDSAQGLPILRISAVRTLSVRLDDIRYYPETDVVPEGALLRNGDLLFTRYNGNPEFTAACGLVSGLTRETTYPDKLIRVRLREVAEPHFVELISASPQSRRWLAPNIKSAAGQHGISGADLKRMPVPLPTLTEQKTIATRVSSAFAWIDRLASETTSACKLIDRLDQAVLAKAFRGDLVPQDPNDEPAGALLERIKNERQGGSVAPSRRRTKMG